MTKKAKIISAIVMATVIVSGLSSCNGRFVSGIGPGEIVIAVEDEKLETAIDTKTTAVTSIPGTLYWGATTGSGSETTKWSSTAGTVSGGVISTGKYQTETPTAYNYYVSNVSMSVGANTTVSATGGTSGTDVVCGRTAASTLTFPTVELNHIFARTGSITTTCTNGSLSSVSYTIKAKGSNTGTSGTYNLRTGVWSSTSGLTSATAITGSSDMYVIPGIYTIAVTATYTRGDYVVTKTMSGDMTLTSNKRNNISITWPDSGPDIDITVTLAPWSERTASVGILTEDIDVAFLGGKLIAKDNFPGFDSDTYQYYFSWGDTMETDHLQIYSMGVKFMPSTFYETDAPYALFWSDDYIYGKYSDGLDEEYILYPEDDFVSSGLGSEWSLPSLELFQVLIDNYTWTWTNINDRYGYIISNSSNSIFLPADGAFVEEDRIKYNEEGYYWTNQKPSPSDNDRFAYCLHFTEDTIEIIEMPRFLGLSARPVRQQTFL